MILTKPSPHDKLIEGGHEVGVAAVLSVDAAKAVQAPGARYALLLKNAPLEVRYQLLHILQGMTEGQTEL